MPIIKERASYRERASRTFYSSVMDEIKRKELPDQFLVRMIFNDIKCLSHLSDSYAYDVLVAVCLTAAKKGDLLRVGRFYSKPKERERSHDKQRKSRDNHLDS